ncbi:MAG: CBS domain-containing protein [Myxococcota bacterium]
MHETLSILLRHKGNDVYSVPPDATVAEAVTAMNRHHVGAVMVTDRDRPVGIFTERDVLRRVVGEGRDPARTRVTEVMTRELVAVRPSVTVAAAMAIITDKRCRHLPVVQDGELLGLVSSGDLTRWIGRGHEVQIQQLIEYVTNSYPA